MNRIPFNFERTLQFTYSSAYIHKLKGIFSASGHRIRAIYFRTRVIGEKPTPILSSEKIQMKYQHFLFMAMLALSSSAHAMQPKVEIFEQFDDLRMVAFLNSDDINNSPAWNPDSGAPPLSVNQAVQAVKDFIKTGDQTGEIRKIEIRQVPKNTERWHYLIKVSNDARKAKFDIFIVLMDGKVIPAIIEPSAYK